MLTTFAADDGFEDGFDDEADPPRLVIGIDDDRSVALWNGQGMHLRSLDPSIATAEFDDPREAHANVRRVTVSGSDWGSTLIEVRHGLHVKGRLRVSVYPRRVVRVNFYRVRDRSGRVPVFNTSMVRRLTTQLNRVYRHQTNTSFVSHLVRDDVPVDLDFATTDQSAEQVKHIWAVLKETSEELDDAPGHYHVFWVKTYGARDKTCRGKVIRDVIGQASAIGGRLCIMEDVHDPHQQGLLLAHELGHCLGAHHDKGHEAALMYPSLEGGGKIYTPTVEEIRGSLD
jgi:hypothetical protein